MQRARIVLIQILVILSLVLGWEAMSRLGVLNASLISAPSQIGIEVYRSFASGQILPHLKITVLEILLGFSLAAIMGIGFGLLVAQVETLYKMLHLPIVLLYALPTISLFPLYVLFFGIGWFQKVIFGASWGVFPVVVHTMAGRRSVPDTLLVLGRSLGGSSGLIWWKIVLPSSLPLVATGLRIGMVYTILGVITAELFISEAGIGQRIAVASQHFQIASYFSYVAIISLISLALTYLVLRIERHLSLWRV